MIIDVVWGLHSVPFCTLGLLTKVFLFKDRTVCSHIPRKAHTDISIHRGSGMENLIILKKTEETTELLPPEMLVMIFQFLSPKDLMMIVFICRRWRDVVEILWSRLTNLDFSYEDLSFYKPGLMASYITRVDTLNILSANLWPEQSQAILTAISEEYKLTNLDISNNDLSVMEPELIASAVSRVDTLNISSTNLRPEQSQAIFTAISEGYKLTNLDFSYNDLSLLEPELLASAVSRVDTNLRPE